MLPVPSPAEWLIVFGLPSLMVDIHITEVASSVNFSLSVPGAECHADRTGFWEYTAAMIILVLDPWLDALLASAALIAQLWPTAAEDIMLIFGALRLAGTTLADTLQNGLVRTLEPIRGAAESQIMLACRASGPQRLRRWS